MDEKILIVEGTNDRRRVKQILNEPVDIICTNGTLSEEKLETIILPIEDKDIYILMDADEAGETMRKQLKRELPHAVHLHTQKGYGQVENTPMDYLTHILRGYFQVKEI